MQTESLQSVATQINILTGVMTFGALLLGGLLAYVKVSTANLVTKEIGAAKKEIGVDIKDASDDIKREMARKDLTDLRLAELDRRLAKTEAWKEAVAPRIPAVEGNE